MLHREIFLSQLKVFVVTGWVRCVTPIPIFASAEWISWAGRGEEHVWEISMADPGQRKSSCCSSALVQLHSPTLARFEAALSEYWAVCSETDRLSRNKFDLLNMETYPFETTLIVELKINGSVCSTEAWERPAKYYLVTKNVVEWSDNNERWIEYCQE